MDFKDKIIMCLVAMVVVLCACLQATKIHEQEPEPANEIIYNVVDDNGHVIGGFRLKK